MKEILVIKFVEYLRENNPDVLFALEEEGSLVSYVNERMQSIDELLPELRKERRPEYLIEELCLEALTSDLKPSRYHYIKEIIEEEFVIEHQYLLQAGILRFEIINLISFCSATFQAFELSEENEDDKNLRYTIIGSIKEYFEKSEKGNSELWPTMPTINL